MRMEYLANPVFEFPPFVRASALSYGGKISERLRVKRESLTGAEVHIGILLPVPLQCAESLFSEDVYGPH